MTRKHDAVKRVIPAKRPFFIDSWRNSLWASTAILIGAAAAGSTSAADRQSRIVAASSAVHVVINRDGAICDAARQTMAPRNPHA